MFYKLFKCESFARALITQSNKRKEVLKFRGQYPGSMLYQMIVTLQKYLPINKKMWRLLDGPDFINLKTVLGNIMQALIIGMTKYK